MKIAIQGHPTRGKEVIQILESLGGIDMEGLTGTCKTFYYINHRNKISDTLKSCLPPTYKYYTLEGFEKEFPFKIGDNVQIEMNNKIYLASIVNIVDIGKYEVKYPSGSIGFIDKKYISIYKEMNTRNITLTLDKAKEWYKKGGELREVALQAYSEKELNPLPRSWEEFYKQGNPIASWRYDAPLKYQALFKLEQLRNCWWNDWEPEWNNCEKYVVKWEGDDLIVFTARRVHAFLVFPTREMAEEFLECFRDLIKIAKDLI